LRKSKKKNIGIIVRVPLASGLLTGKLNKQSTFEKEDHRFFNRDGAAFDKGETYAGIPYETGRDAVDELKDIFTDNELLVLPALKWILMFPEVNCIIPGASRPSHVTGNVKASDSPDISNEKMVAVKDIYEKRIKRFAHYCW